jgi:membrane-bound lytic murein transglycosylase B
LARRQARGAPYGEVTANFEAMRECNGATVYRKTIGYFTDLVARSIMRASGAQ